MTRLERPELIVADVACPASTAPRCARRSRPTRCSVATKIVLLAAERRRSASARCAPARTTCCRSRSIACSLLDTARRLLVRGAARTAADPALAARPDADAARRLGRPRAQSLARRRLRRIDAHRRAAERSRVHDATARDARLARVHRPGDLDARRAAAPLVRHGVALPRARSPHRTRPQRMGRGAHAPPTPGDGGPSDEIALLAFSASASPPSRLACTRAQSGADPGHRRRQRRSERRRRDGSLGEAARRRPAAPGCRPASSTNSKTPRAVVQRGAIRAGTPRRSTSTIWRRRTPNEAARRALPDVVEDARRAGVPPGVLAPYEAGRRGGFAAASADDDATDEVRTKTLGRRRPASTELRIGLGGDGSGAGAFLTGAAPAPFRDPSERPEATSRSRTARRSRASE